MITIEVADNIILVINFSVRTDSYKPDTKNYIVSSACPVYYSVVHKVHNSCIEYFSLVVTLSYELHSAMEMQRNVASSSGVMGRTMNE